MTNEEWLKSLPAEEFVSILELTSCKTCKYFKARICEAIGDNNKNCVEGNIKWLKQEHKE